ncbi:interleukin-11-like [Salmo trutta]|uniref:Interleukin-11-like n=1 Tax=Salmo trutta TaxID=8032 RepID=A0A674F4U8_SALTR|nr:interleukin-11-like [Salmo trutta]
MAKEAGRDLTSLSDPPPSLPPSGPPDFPPGGKWGIFDDIMARSSPLSALSWLNSTQSLLLLLLLAQLLVLSWSRPSHKFPLCARLTMMVQQMRNLQMLTRNLQSESEFSGIELLEYNLDTLPEMEHTANHLSSLKLNDSLSQLYTDFRSFKLHLDWLIDVRVSMSLPVSLKTVEVTRGLQHILSLCSTALQQIACPLPQISIPSFPTRLTTWDVVLLSYEIPERLGFYCQWSTRVLVLLKSQVQGL